MMSGDSTCAGGEAASGHSRSISVLLVENDLRSAAAIARDFARSGVKVTVARTLADARVCLHQSQPAIDVVISELRLPDGRGESLLADIEACPRQPAVIITSAFPAELQAAALEYRPVVVAKSVGTSALLRTVRTVVGGYAKPVIKRFVSGFDLSKRETESIVLVAQGLRAKEIAERMRCSEPTVYGHLARVCEKTGCSDYHEVVARLFAFACQAVGHTPPDHKAFVDGVHSRAIRR